jgi:hypothetical protein
MNKFGMLFGTCAAALLLVSSAIPAQAGGTSPTNPWLPWTQVVGAGHCTDMAAVTKDKAYLDCMSLPGADKLGCWGSSTDAGTKVLVDCKMNLLAATTKRAEHLLKIPLLMRTAPGDGQ